MALAGDLADRRDSAKYTSTQEDAWTLVAAAALARETADGSVSVDGEALTGSVYRRYLQEEIEATPVEIANGGNSATEARVSVTAIPLVPPEASSAGFTIIRDYYLPDGSWVEDISQVSQNDRFVVVLTMS